MHGCKLLRCFKRAAKVNRRHFSKIHQDGLLDHLQRRIQIAGPLSVAAYMKEALTNPIWGYYMKKDVFGASGDFTTSPEISQMFGEMVGVWFLNEWIQAKQPEQVNLVELGPGRGTLMADILRVFDKFKAIKTGLSVHLIEVSEEMKRMQRNKLCDVSSQEKECETAVSKCGVQISWHSDIKDTPKGHTFYLAHEFLDALPVHLFKRNKHGWREVLVDADRSSLQYALAPGKSTLAELFIPKSTKLDEYEVCPDAGVIVEHMSNTLAAYGGSSLIVDYGNDSCGGHSLRSFRNHKIEEDILKDPGSGDITANVDFSFLKRSTKNKVDVFGPVTQAEFLKRMGIETRYQILLKNANDKQASHLKSAYEYLMSEEKMGHKFKVMSLKQTGSERPAAF